MHLLPEKIVFPELTLIVVGRVNSLLSECVLYVHCGLLVHGRPFAAPRSLLFLLSLSLIRLPALT